MVETETLDKMCQEHPVLAFAKANYSMEPSPQLGRYVTTVQSHAGIIPQTLTEFYKGYVHFVILDYISKHHGDYSKKWQDAEIKNVMQVLSQIAFCERFRKLKMNDAILRKYFVNVATKNIDVTKSDLVHMSFGILTRDRSNRVVTFKFRDQGMQEYFCAMFQCQECERKWKKHKLLRSVSDGSVQTKPKRMDLPQSVRDSIHLLPITGGIWRMTFGLLSHDLGTRRFQEQLLREIIQRSMYNVIMTSFDITSLCVDFVYESQNRSHLAEHLEDFTVNQTLCFSNAIVSPLCVPYMLSSVAFIVQCTKEIFALYFSRFGVTSSNIQWLASPSHFSDTYLQVLNLSDNNLGDDGVRKLQPLLLNATSLTHLDMSKCNIGNDGMLYIAECTMNLPLLYLRLANNNIDDGGLKPLVRRLKYCGTLEMLDLANNNLTDRSVIQLGKALYNLPNLRGLDLRGNAIGEKGLDVVSDNLSQLDKTLRVVHEPDDPTEPPREKPKKNPLWQTKSLRKAGTNLNPKHGILKKGRYKTQREHVEDDDSDEDRSRNRRTEAHMRRARIRFSNGSIAESPLE